MPDACSIERYFDEAKKCVSELYHLKLEVLKAVEACCAALASGNKIIFCGNGGSAAEAQHLSAELMGRFLIERSPLPSISLTVDTSAITAIGNDYGFDKIFCRQLDGIGNSGDVLIGLTTSGASSNLEQVFELASSLNIRTILLTGENAGTVDAHSEIVIRAPHDQTNHIQECHLIIGHVICAEVEKHFFKNNT